MRRRVITIDGPAGSGKSTVAREVAQRLGYTFLDTGAIYRAAALAVLESGCNAKDGDACAGVLSRCTIDMQGRAVFLNGHDVTSAIRTPAISDMASAIAVHPQVRSALTEIQRDLARRASVVAEGRDTGSVVFPHADLKIFLDADIGERARRRHAELAGTGMDTNMEDVITAMLQRDERDRTRPTSPLVIPEHAVVVDTTHLSVDEVVGVIVSLAEERLAD